MREAERQAALLGILRDLIGTKNLGVTISSNLINVYIVDH